MEFKKDFIFTNRQRFFKLKPAVDAMRRRCAGAFGFNSNKLMLLGREFDDSGRRSFFIVDRKEFTKRYEIGEINYYYEVKFVF